MQNTRKTVIVEHYFLPCKLCGETGGVTCEEGEYWEYSPEEEDGTEGFFWHWKCSLCNKEELFKE